MVDRPWRDDVDDLMLWTETQGGSRVHVYSVRRLVGALLPGEPRTVLWLMTNVRAISERIEGVLPSARSTYASRVKHCCRNFLLLIGQSLPDPKPWLTRTTLPAVELTPEQQIAEALAFLSKNEFLRAYMLPALAAAQRDLSAMDADAVLEKEKP